MLPALLSCLPCRRVCPALQRKDDSVAVASQLGCEHCESSADGCPHCWKTMLKVLGDRAVLQPPADKVAAAMATPAPEEGEEEAPAPHQPEQRQKAKPKRGAIAAAGGPAAPSTSGGEVDAKPAAVAAPAAAAAAAAGAAGDVVKFGSRINNAAIRVWWPGDRTFYPARVTSYKQGCVSGWLGGWRAGAAVGTGGQPGYAACLQDEWPLHLLAAVSACTADRWWLPIHRCSQLTFRPACPPCLPVPAPLLVLQPAPCRL